MTGISSKRAKAHEVNKNARRLMASGHCTEALLDQATILELVRGIEVVGAAARVVVAVVVPELLALVRAACHQAERRIAVEQVENTERDHDVLARVPGGLDVGGHVLLDVQSDRFGPDDVARTVEALDLGLLVPIAGLEVDA